MTNLVVLGHLKKIVKYWTFRWHTARRHYMHFADTVWTLWTADVICRQCCAVYINFVDFKAAFDSNDRQFTCLGVVISRDRIDKVPSFRIQKASGAFGLSCGLQLQLQLVKLIGRLHAIEVVRHAWHWQTISMSWFWIKRCCISCHTRWTKRDVSKKKKLRSSTKCYDSQATNPFWISWNKGTLSECKQ